MLANQMIVRATIHRLLHELQDRYPVTAEIPREEVFAWLDSRTTHWFANARPHAEAVADSVQAEVRIPDLSVCPRCGKPGAHFVPPSLGEPGLFICDPNNQHKDCPTQSASTQPRRLACPADTGLADYINGGHGDLRETEHYQKAWRHG
jgi:hypothetical protein